MNLKTILAVCAVVVSSWWGAQPAVAQEPQEPVKALPLVSPSAVVYTQPAYGWSLIHQRARIEAEGRLMRTEFNRAIGHSPARPNLNASYLSGGSQMYYMPARQQFVNAGVARGWYW